MRRTLNLIVFALVLFAMFCAAAPFVHGQGVGIYMKASGIYFPPSYPGSYYNDGIGYGYNTLPLLPYNGGILSALLFRHQSPEAQAKKEDGKNLQRAGKATKDVMKQYLECVSFQVKLGLENATGDCKEALSIARTPINK